MFHQSMMESMKPKKRCESITEGHESVVLLPSEGINAGNTNTKLISNVRTTDKVLPPPAQFTSNVTATDKVLPPSVDDVTPAVVTSSINDKDPHLATGNPVVDVSHVAYIANSYVIVDSSSEFGDMVPVEKGNLKIGDGNEKCDPWDKFTSDEIKGQYFAVAVGRNEHSVGVYADLTRFKLEIEGHPTSLYQTCDSYIEAHHYLETYLNNVAHEKVEISTVLSKVPFLRSATTNTRAIKPDGTSEIENHCQPSILHDSKTDIQKRSR
jgi:hypothetical protein